MNLPMCLLSKVFICANANEDAARWETLMKLAKGVERRNEEEDGFQNMKNLLGRMNSFKELMDDAPANFFNNYYKEEGEHALELLWMLSRLNLSEYKSLKIKLSENLVKRFGKAVESTKFIHSSDPPTGTCGPCACLMSCELGISSFRAISKSAAETADPVTKYYTEELIREETKRRNQ